MSLVVVDASAALAWLLKSQATVESNRFLVATESEWIAPAIFNWEVRNVLLTMLYKRSLTILNYEEAMNALAELPVSFGLPHRPEEVESLARHEQLSLFNASYLAQALIENAGLASRDKGLLNAARRNGVEVWDLR